MNNNQLFCTFIKKKCEKVWLFKKKAVPLHRI